MTLYVNAYGSAFYMTTGFHAIHVTGGLIAFLLIIGRTFTTRAYTHRQATGAMFSVSCKISHTLYCCASLVKR